MLEFEKKTGKSEKMGRRTGFLIGLLIFASMLIFILTRFHVLIIGWTAYFAVLLLIILIYLLVLTIKNYKSKKKVKRELIK